KSKRCSVDRLLAEGPKSFPLKGAIAVADFTARKKRLQLIVGRAGQDHPAQNFSPLISGQRCFDGRAPQEPVAPVEQFLVRLLQADIDADPRRRIANTVGNRTIVEQTRKLASKPRTEGIEARSVGRHVTG